MLKDKNTILPFVIIIMVLCSIYFSAMREMMYTGVNESPSFVEVLRFILDGLI